ncbi:efflux RND transporter periplasmic adaptor subunit [Marinobacterium lutimaris]|uniref:Membrane fusion protein, multidrug efflux system n=1 Tax=Marinobacterium lutimaris TaxID=568106 RepID=A0A1H6DE25_9GAMM|nr:efflux RND transporter periplasmic adaptor subunit [Marinobacterium lutimaris]SEG82806.1 membrane fusion protein, multidrug efflux system [Marinobacterium lutimaris]
MERTFNSSRRWPLVVVSSLLIALAGCQDSSEQQAGAEQPPAQVDVVTLNEQPVDIKDTYAARVSAFRTAEIRPQVEGIILKRTFEEGSEVQAGDLLYQIDPAVYEAELASAKAQLAVAQANAQSSKLLAERYGQLVQSSAVSRQEADDAAAAWKQAQAQIQSAQAAVKSAQINLDYTEITAPISGIISRSNITEGALVSVGQSQALATIRQYSPAYVDIRQPATTALKMKRDSNDRSVHLTLEDGTTLEEVGTLKFSERSVDEGTGTVNVRAVFENSDGLLLPGMFVRATVVLSHRDSALLAPQEGVIRQPNGSVIAMVVNSDNVVESRPIEVEAAIGSNWLVKSGLEAGESIIVAGLQKIQPGASVVPQERGKPAAQNGEGQ